MKQDERFLILKEEFDRYDRMHIQNILHQDQTLVQLSVGLLAILATFGREILSTNITIGYIVVILFGLTIAQVVLGYFLSNNFFNFAKRKLNDNYQSGVDPVTKDLDQSFEGKVNDFLNITGYITFFFGIIFFVVLLIIYLKEV